MPSRTGPTAVRVSRSTLCPTRARMRRISRFFPSRSTISKTVLSLWCDLTVTLLRPRYPFGQMDALEQFRQHLAVGPAGHHHAIRLAHAVARMGQPIGQLAVVGDQDQPIAVQIESADREQPGVLWLGTRSTTRGRPDGSRLVQSTPTGLLTA